MYYFNTFINLPPNFLKIFQLWPPLKICNLVGFPIPNIHPSTTPSRNLMSTLTPLAFTVTMLFQVYWKKCNRKCTMPPFGHPHFSSGRWVFLGVLSIRWVGEVVLFIENLGHFRGGGKGEKPNHFELPPKGGNSLGWDKEHGPFSAYGVYTIDRGERLYIGFWNFSSVTLGTGDMSVFTCKIAYVFLPFLALII